jgi:purine-binding chemotaxis protein CheW
MTTTITTRDSADKYLTMILADEAYGIAVLKVREIIRLLRITAIPQMPDYVKGVINLRGRIVPVIDLRVKFGLVAATTERTCVIVVEVQISENRTTQMGLIADSVEEVVLLTEAEIEPVPDFGVRIDTSYLRGIAKVKGQIKTLLDIDKVVAPETVAALAA